MMRTTRGVACAAVLLTLVIPVAQGGSPQAAGQAQQQAVDKPLQYEVSVVLKLIHVYVTDKKGNPVPDLTASDFIVTDNGQPMTVTDFERRVVRAAAPAIAPAEAPAPAPPAKKVEPAAPGVKSENRKFFLFFDFAFNNPRGITKAKRAALHFLDTDVAPEDEVALVSYSLLKGMTVHEYLTADHAKVREALGTIGQKDIVGRADEVEEQYWQQATEGLRTWDNSQGGGLKESSQEIRETNIKRWESRQTVQRFLLVTTALAKALRIVPGQKQFILFSSGIPASLLYGNQAGTPMGNRDGNTGKWEPGSGVLFETGDPVLRSASEAMNREFAAAGCSFFIFDTRESAMKTSMFDRESQTLETGNRSAAFSPTSAFEANSPYKSNRITGAETLGQLAKATGGEYFSNIDRYEKNFDQVQAMTGTFYVLGFPVNERWDGKFHEIKVDVKRKDCEVRAQAGYFNPKPFSDYSDLEKQLHLFDLALNERAFSRLPLSLPMTTLTSAAEGITRLGVLAGVPTEVTEKLSGSRVEFVTIFFDGSGEISDVVREERDLGSLRGHDLVFGAGAALKPGDYACRLVIRDMASGLSAVASAKATVGKPSMTALALGTPLVLGPGTGRTFLYAAAKKARQGFPWTEIYPFDGSLFAPVLAELPRDTASVLAVVPCAVPAGGKPELAVSAYLTNTRTGARSDVPIIRSDSASKGPLEILSLELYMADVVPGAYYLHINAQDRATGSLGHAFTTLTVQEAR